MARDLVARLGEPERLHPPLVYTPPIVIVIVQTRPRGRGFEGNRNVRTVVLPPMRLVRRAILGGRARGLLRVFFTREVDFPSDPQGLPVGVHVTGVAGPRRVENLKTTMGKLT